MTTKCPGCKGNCGHYDGYTRWWICGRCMGQGFVEACEPGDMRPLDVCPPVVVTATRMDLWGDEG